MIGISKLYCGAVEASDVLRYGRHSGKLPSHLLQFSKDKKPVVVWNTTRTCNLKCIHCYSQSDNKQYPDELSTEQGLAFIRDLAEFKSPVILFSGGEPLMRKDLFRLIEEARSKNMRAVLSTNGTLINRETAKKLKTFGLSYVGISLDGMEKTNDAFRMQKGAFKKAIEGIRNCKEEGIKVGLRFTINKHNYKDIPAIMDFIEEEDIPRICFYHLVYSGRGSELIEEDLPREESRKTVEFIMKRTQEYFKSGKPREVLTVDNHCDGVFIYLKLKKEDPKRAEEVYQLLKMNGGNSTGNGIGCVSWTGDIHADQFLRHYSFGNVRERKFSEIWTDTNIELLHKFKNKIPHLKGRCGLCQYKDICGGNFRARAEAVTGDIWEADPACYLTDEEIGVK